MSEEKSFAHLRDPLAVGWSGWVAFAYLLSKAPEVSLTATVMAIKQTPRFFPCPTCGQHFQSYIEDSLPVLEKCKDTDAFHNWLSDAYIEITKRNLQEMKERHEKVAKAQKLSTEDRTELCEHHLRRKRTSNVQGIKKEILKDLKFDYIALFHVYFFFLSCLLCCKTQSEYSACLDWLEVWDALSPKPLFAQFALLKEDVKGPKFLASPTALPSCPSVHSLAELLK